jgi:hypothetical protein
MFPFINLWAQLWNKFVQFGRPSCIFSVPHFPFWRYAHWFALKKSYFHRFLLNNISSALNAPYRWQWHKNSCKLSSLYINLCYAKKTHVFFFTDACTYVYSNIKLSKTISIVILAAIYFDATTIPQTFVNSHGHLSLYIHIENNPTVCGI